jgi:site-specific recombinase XerD
MKSSATNPELAPLLQSFFASYLIDQRNVSHQTVASYRDKFRLLLTYLRTRLRREPSSLLITDISAQVVPAFLAHLERDRGNGVSTRNPRLAAIRSFIKYAALRFPSNLADAQSVLAIPLKKRYRKQVEFLSKEEIEILLHTMDLETWSGRRDHTLFVFMYNTGARVSEATGLKRCDLDPVGLRSAMLHGKGRKERVVPLWKSTANELARWLAENGGLDGSAGSLPVFPNRNGACLTRSGVEYRLRRTIRIAAHSYQFLKGREITPHTLRHTTAMHLLQAGIDPAVIALWLGHDSLTSTRIYVQADLAMKERALAKIKEPEGESIRYIPSDSLLAFLESL